MLVHIKELQLLISCNNLSCIYPVHFLIFYFVLGVVFSIFFPFSSSVESKALPCVTAASLSNGLGLHVYSKSDGFLKVPT